MTLWYFRKKGSYTMATIESAVEARLCV